MTARKNIINRKARSFSRGLIYANVSIYLIAFLGIVASDFTADFILDHVVCVFWIAFIPLIISLFIALFNKTVDDRDKMNLSFFYFALIGINLIIGAFIYLLNSIDSFGFG